MTVGASFSSINCEIVAGLLANHLFVMEQQGEQIGMVDQMRPLFAGRNTTATAAEPVILRIYKQPSQRCPDFVRVVASQPG